MGTAASHLPSAPTPQRSSGLRRWTPQAGGREVVGGPVVGGEHVPTSEGIDAAEGPHPPTLLRRKSRIGAVERGVEGEDTPVFRQDPHAATRRLEIVDVADQGHRGSSRKGLGSGGGRGSGHPEKREDRRSKGPPHRPEGLVAVAPHPVALPDHGRGPSRRQKREVGAATAVPRRQPCVGPPRRDRAGEPLA